MSEFKKYEPGTIPHIEVELSFNYETLYMSKKLGEALGDPETIDLYFDEETKQLAIGQGETLAAYRNDCKYWTDIRGFCKAMEIEFPKPFSVETFYGKKLSDGRYVFDLSELF